MSRLGDDFMNEDPFQKQINWRGYTVSYCDLCEVFIIKCKEPNCDATSCNAGSCDKCHDDITEFNKLKIHPFNFLSEEEKNTYRKISLLREYIGDCLAIGVEPIDWQVLEAKGYLCKMAYKLFPEETKNLKGYGNFEGEKESNS